MILVDFSSILHRMIYSSISSVNPSKRENGKFETSEYINFTKHLILSDLLSVNHEHGRRFGVLVICLDNHSGSYWRKDIYPYYKSKRKSNREESEVDFSEVFKEINELIDQIDNNLPWKVISVPRTEADDVILVLSNEYSRFEEILIYSPDKDLIQAQRNENVYQYSPITKKWIVPENKHEHMAHWIQEHICLGDPIDEIPKIVDETEFSENFIKYLVQNGYNITNPLEFRELSEDEQNRLIQNYNVYKPKKENIKDIYKDIRFGPSTLKKKIKEYGSLKDWVNSNPLYLENFRRNYKLVMAEGIPTEIWNNIIIAYKTAKTDYNEKEFFEYLRKNNLNNILMEYSGIFSANLLKDKFDWED